jgi:hypothetical protein
MPNFELSRLLDHSDDAIIAEIKRVARLIEEPAITARAFDRLSKVHSSGIRRRFGGWRKALIKAGLQDRYSGTIVTEKMKLNCGKRHTNEDILSELKRVATELGVSSFTAKTFTQHSKIHSESVVRRFGSWVAALTSAGLTPGRGAKRYTEQDYFENLLNVWTHYGRQPKYDEMDEAPSRISSGAYEAKWGKWTNALRAFLARMEQEGKDDKPRAPDTEKTKAVSAPESGESQGGTSSIRNLNTIRLGLRYDVLKRDRFRCSICGATPASDLSVELHVDHIHPRSAGGETAMTNLRTLCSRCNLGKSDKLENESVS